MQRLCGVFDGLQEAWWDWSIVSEAERGIEMEGPDQAGLCGLGTGSQFLVERQREATAGL